MNGKISKVIRRWNKARTFKHRLAKCWTRLEKKGFILAYEGFWLSGVFGVSLVAGSDTEEYYGGKACARTAARICRQGKRLLRKFHHV